MFEIERPKEPVVFQSTLQYIAPRLLDKLTSERLGKLKFTPRPEGQ